MKKYIAFILILATALSCRKDVPIDGPKLNDLFGEFNILSEWQFNTQNIDFAAGETFHIDLALSKTSNWQLRITGLTSGAEKLVTGLNQDLNAEAYSWDGSTTTLPMFKAEDCRVELTFPGESDTMLVGTVTITSPKVNQGVVVADFENGFNSGWSSFFQSGANMDFQVKNNPAESAQGGAYYNMQGEVNWDWLIGLVNFEASAQGMTTYPLANNPDKVFFNAMIYGEPGLVNSLVLFQFDEDENGDGTFDANNEDRFAYEIPVTWAGWKLVSMSYTDIAALSTGSGNDSPNPDKLVSVNMLHLANPNSGIAKSKLDYIIFTENAALNP
jgi:hypothetical protein